MFAVKRFLTALPKWLLSGITLTAILWLTLAPKPFGDTDIPLFPGADKLAHALMFGSLTAMLCLDRQRTSAWKRVSTRFVLSAAACSGLLGLAIEYLQLRMQVGRSFEPADAYSDIAGSCMIAVCWIFLQPHWSAEH